MPPTEECVDASSKLETLIDVVATMLRNGIINTAHHDVLDPIDPYAGGPVPYLPNLRDLLRRASGTDDLASISVLSLRVMTRDFGLQHLSTHTPNLRELILDGSTISSLRDLGSRLHTLRVLRINECKLKCLDGLNGLRNIEKLCAANNKLTDLTPCTALEFLHHIDVAGNLINDMTTVEFLVLCGTLKELVLEDNFALCTRPTYRQDVRRLIPQLVSLDGIEYADPPGKPHYSLPRDENQHQLELPDVNDEPSADLSTAPATGCYSVSFAPKVLLPRSHDDTTAGNETG